MATTAPGFQRFELLDRRPALPPWEPALHKVLTDIYKLLPVEDKAILGCFRSFMDALGPFVVQDCAIPIFPPGLHRDHPITTTLLAVNRRSSNSELINRLAAIMVCAALDPETYTVYGHKKLLTLAEKIRGVNKDPNSSLRLRLAEARSIPKLVEIMEKDRDSPDGLRDGFGRLWDKWLSSVIARWRLNSEDHLRNGLVSASLRPDLGALALPVFIENNTDADDGTEVTSYLVEGTPAGEEEPSTRARYARARHGRMIRTSEGNLLADPSHVLPEPLIIRIVTAASAAARVALDANMLREANPIIALELLIAAGLREIELSDIVWGDKDSNAYLVLDRVNPMLYRRVCRPPNAAKAENIPEQWLSPTSDMFGFPVPPSLYSRIKELTGPVGPQLDWDVFEKESAAGSRIDQLREIVKKLTPDAATGVGRFRMNMASKLALEFGTEIPQIIMADTFSMSAAPAYYGSIPEERLYRFIAGIQKGWFGEDCYAASSASSNNIGSRISLNDDGARKWSDALNKKRNSLVRSKFSADFALLSNHRDRLAAALVSATGHRPSNQIGQIELDQIIPEYGLITLKDKQSDVLRTTRIAATGTFWVNDLRRYLDRLVSIAAREPESHLGRHALAILRSEAPIFSLPGTNGEIVPFNAGSLRALMPMELQPHDNFYRHRLNQYLQGAGLDPELRHCQLGWVVGPASALADLSPLAARDFGELVGPKIDEMLVKDGWYPVSRRKKPWNWNGIPLRVDTDWNKVIRDHENAHKKNIHDLKEKLRQERAVVVDKIKPRMAKAIARLFPKLMIDPESFELKPAPAYENWKFHVIQAEDHWRICEDVRQSDDNPVNAIEAVVTRGLLYQLIKKARNGGLVTGPLPSRDYLNLKDMPSPFPPGLGLAVRQAEAFKAILIQRLGQSRANESSILAQLSILACTPYRSIKVAKSAVKNANRLVRSQKNDGIVRLPVKVDKQEVQLVLGGISAVAMGKLANSRKNPAVQSEDGISTWLWKHCRGLFDANMPKNQLEDQLVAILRMAGRLQLSGPERLVMLEHDVVATVPVNRSVADDDMWPVRTRATDTQDESVAYVETYDSSDQKPQVVEPERARTDSGYSRLRKILNPDYRAPSSGPSDGHHRWRGKLNRELNSLIAEYGKQSNLGVLAEFVRRRLLDGGDHKRKLAQGTLYKELTHFGSALLNLMGKRSILSLSESDYQDIYLELLIGKSEAYRAYVFESLKMFHKHLTRIHGVSEISFDAIAEFAGPRVVRPDMGLLTTAELRATLNQLHDDLNEEVQRTDANPSLLRLYKLRIVMFHILEASGIRPGSAHGLTLGDLHFFGTDQDVVHVHKTGEYGQAKSEASVGYFPLEGRLWHENRDWVMHYVKNEVMLLSGTDWWKIPVFAESLGSRVRFKKDYITQRFDQLFKWASNEKSARTYWLRKNRITSKHRAAISKKSPKARDVYGAITSSGQAGIGVALTNYINDPAVVMSRSLRESSTASRKSMLEISAMPAAVLDMAWIRNRRNDYSDRVQPILDRMNIKLLSQPDERLTPPPKIKRSKRLTPSDIDVFARTQQRYERRGEAIIRSGLSDVQADALDVAARKLLAVRGKTPWELPEMTHSRDVLRPARALHGAEGVLKALGSMPCDDMLILSEAWAAQSHINKLFSADAIIILEDDELHDAAARILRRFPTLNLTIDSEPAGRVLKKPESPTRKLSHASAVEWVLAISWIFSRSRQCIQQSQDWADLSE